MDDCRRSIPDVPLPLASLCTDPARSHFSNNGGRERAVRPSQAPNCGHPVASAPCAAPISFLHLSCILTSHFSPGPNQLLPCPPALNPTSQDVSSRGKLTAPGQSGELNLSASSGGAWWGAWGKPRMPRGPFHLTAVFIST